MRPLTLCDEILQVVLGEKPYAFYAYFNDGTVHYYDAENLIKSASSDSVFAALKDIEIFRNKITVLCGTVAWDLRGDRNPTECIDIAPDVIHEGMLVRDPLEKNNSSLTQQAQQKGWPEESDQPFKVD